MLRLIALVLVASAAFAGDTPAAAADACTPIAAEQVPAAAKAKLVAAGADAAKITTCTKDGVVLYCAIVNGADGTKPMLAVDATGTAVAAASEEGCGACCAPKAAKAAK